MNNLYWTIYKNLEKEVASLADLIHFDDNQLSVYSVRIADLLIRCAVEIEAISKELYVSNSGTLKPIDKDGKERTLYFDTDCLDFLDKEWALGEKQVLISNTNSYFECEENKVLKPLKKANVRGKCDWKKTYQAIKHNRGENLKKANIKSLLRALAALYILNIYYKDERFMLTGSQKLSDATLGSSIFSVGTAVLFPKFPNTDIEINEKDLSAVYIIKITNNGYAKYYNEAKTAFQKQKDALFAAGYEPQKNEDDEAIDIDYADIYRIAIEVGGSELVGQISNMEQNVQKTRNIPDYEAILNKKRTLKIMSEELGGRQNG